MWPEGIWQTQVGEKEGVMEYFGGRDPLPIEEIRWELARSALQFKKTFSFTIGDTTHRVTPEEAREILTIEAVDRRIRNLKNKKVDARARMEQEIDFLNRKIYYEKFFNRQLKARRKSKAKT